MTSNRCECSSAGRASRCQRDCRRFDSGHSLHFFLPHRRFMTETHIDFPLEISGKWYIFSLKYSLSLKPYACLICRETNQHFMDQMDQIDQMDDFIFLITLKVHWVHWVHPVHFKLFCVFDAKCNSGLFQFRLSIFLFFCRVLSQIVDEPKFSPFLLRQGYGGQAGSKDGVTFILRFA